MNISSLTLLGTTLLSTTLLSTTLLSTTLSAKKLSAKKLSATGLQATQTPAQGLSSVIALPARFTSILLVACFSLVACTSAAPVQVVTVNEPKPEPPPPQVIACVPEVDVAEQTALRKLALANAWHTERRYSSALEAYESALAENASDISDAYALFGLIAMRLDRNSPTYDRDIATLTMHVLEQRASAAQRSDAAQEARLLLFSARAMVAADIDKDNVIIENRRLREDLAQRDEALKRLRELTIGR